MAGRPNWTALPAARSSAPILQIKLYAILGVLLFAAVCGVLAIMRVSSLDIPTVEPTSGQPRAGALTEIAARDFLEGRRTTVPVAVGVDPMFGRDEPRGDAEAPEGLTVVSLTRDRWELVTLGNQVVEIHTFDAVVDGQSPWVVTVTALVGDRGAVLAAQPSIAPRVYPDLSGVAAFDYRNVDGAGTGAVPEPVAEVIERWADAYAAGDGAALQAVVDDPSGTADSYVGIGGMVVADGGVETITYTEVSAGLLVRVRVLFSADGANGFSASNDFDLLLAQAQTTTPKVVAWGPPGSGPTLTPYQNRIATATNTPTETQP